MHVHLSTAAEQLLQSTANLRFDIQAVLATMTTLSNVLAEQIEGFFYEEDLGGAGGTDNAGELDMLGELEIDPTDNEQSAPDDQILAEAENELCEDDDESDTSQQSLDKDDLAGQALRNLDATLQTEDESQFDPEALAMLRSGLSAVPHVSREERKKEKRERKRRKRSRRQLNYGLTSLVDRIKEPLYDKDQWIWDRNAALTVTNEDARSHQIILARMNDESFAVPPRRGMQRRQRPPSSVAEARFDQWMCLTTPRLYTTNVIATFHLGHQVNLFSIVSKLGGVCFNPRCFAAAKLRCVRATHLIFSGGAVVCAGANSPQMANIACVECALLLNRVGVMSEMCNFSLQNVVSTADAGFEVDLFELSHAYPVNAHYDPHCFPGLMFRLTKGRLVFIVFKSGKCIIAGMSSRTDSLVAWRWFHSWVLWEFEMRSDARQEDEADYRRRRRREQSIIQPMCESLRDLTVAHATHALANSNTPDDVRDIYAAITTPQDPLTAQFESIIDAGRRVAQDVDVRQWLEEQDDIADLDAPLPEDVRAQLIELDMEEPMRTDQ